MGNKTSTRLTSVDGNPNRKPMPERDRYGVCTVKIAPITTPPIPTTNRRIPDQNSYVITPKGGIIHGSQCNPQLIQRGVSFFNKKFYYQ